LLKSRKHRLLVLDKPPPPYAEF